jgi:hypothetical protein
MGLSRAILLVSYGVFGLATFILQRKTNRP